MMRYSFNFREKQIAFDYVGEGSKTVFLLHGFCEDTYIWEEVIERLSPHFKVLYLDLPGYCFSETIPDATITTYGECCLALLEHLQIEKAIWVGHSMGGYTALEALAIAPKKFLGLAMVHSHPFGDKPEKKENRNKSIHFIDQMGHIPFVKQLIPTLFAPVFAANNTFVIDKLVVRAARSKADGIKIGLTAMRDRPDRSATLANANVPVLFINGEKDRAMDQDDIKNQTALPSRSSLHVFENVGHMIMFESPRTFYKTLKEFCDWCIA